MPEIRIPYRGELVAYRCDKCNIGYLEDIDNSFVEFSYPLQWTHHCTHCDFKTNFSQPLPCFEGMDNKNRIRRFLLQDKSPTPKGLNQPSQFRWLK